MGIGQSYPGLTEDVLEDYTTLTYLNKGEILYLMKKFYSIDPDKIRENYHHRFEKDVIIKKFDVLQNNPFQDRIFHVFSSNNDDCFSFEDMLDLCSAMSSECPTEVKAAWAFRIFDLDEDGQISMRDISEIIDRLTGCSKDRFYQLDDESKTKIAHVILDEIKLYNTGGIGLNEFKIIMTRIPEFHSSFYFRV
ncbi:PREDICTED: calcium and integrin-binding protein 1-like [Papilio polytes]|uniref:calcium and integrin-binding protein 1-like n=1 Tax=Papilio polytes TaxID=76194 RepID=UPI0006763E0F|nr:PREDICTED: calcium and integrin-binding protein 1-like [Papilio polytes]